MSETKVNEKKVVGRNVAIALGIICIILAVGLVATFVYYTYIINSSNSASEYTRIVLIGGSVYYTFNQYSYQFFGPFSSSNSQLMFGVAVQNGIVANYNATVGATYEYSGIEIKVSEIHSDYIVLLAKSL